MRLLHHRILCLLAAAVILTLAATSHAQTEPLNYKDMDIPIIDGATDITDEWNEDFYTRTIEYRLEVKSDEDVLNFYTDFFKSNGWGHIFDELPKVPDHPPLPSTQWSAFSFRATPGNPHASFFMTWIYKNPTLQAAVMLKHKDYIEAEEIFISKISLSITPNLQNVTGMPDDSYWAIGELLEKNPKNVFLVERALRDALNEKGIIDPVKFDKTAIPEEYKDKEIIQAYIKMIEDYKARYQQFGKKYFPETTQNAQ